MRKKLCDRCTGSCDTPDVHCTIRLHMSHSTLSELIKLLEFSKRHLNLLVKFELEDEDYALDYFNCANHWYEHLLKVLSEYHDTRNHSKNGRKFVVERITSHYL